MSNEYWENRYVQQETPWDIGYASPALSSYFQNLYHKDLKILIPGGGNSHEAEYLWKNGFKNIWVIDISPTAIDNFLERFPDFPKSQALVGDFFLLNEKFDVILEQTFFCALNPELRLDYVLKMKSLLYHGGKIVGLLFNFPLTEKGPPFGGSHEEYIGLFRKDFKIHILNKAYNSIKPREGKEFFFQFIAR